MTESKDVLQVQGQEVTRESILLQLQQLKLNIVSKIQMGQQSAENGIQLQKW